MAEERKEPDETDGKPENTEGQSTSSMREMPFLEHLEELRWSILKALISILIFMIASFFFSDIFVNFLIEPTKDIDPPLTLQVLKVQGMFMVKMWVAFVGGLIVSIPVIVYQAWNFVSPGLYPKEKKHLPALIVITFFCFIAGASFAYYVIIPLALPALLSFGVEGVENNISINYYFGFVLQLIIASGIIFEMPVLSFFLSKIGILSPAFLRHYRRYAIMAMIIIAAVLTPPDPMSQVLLAIPLLILYEASIYVSAVGSRGWYKDIPKPKA